jgi:hypothetical protein
MVRSSFLCPIDEHLCNDPNCSQNHCKERGREADRERRLAEREKEIEALMEFLDCTRIQAIDLIEHPERAAVTSTRSTKAPARAETNGDSKQSERPIS